MTWYGQELRLGCRVVEEDNPRHVGILEAVTHGLCKVRWLDNGYISYLHRDDLRRANEEE